MVRAIRMIATDALSGLPVLFPQKSQGCRAQSGAVQATPSVRSAPQKSAMVIEARSVATNSISSQLSQLNDQLEPRITQV